ncbi:hypothetical protein [Kitasatospora herbaricolor]
MRVQSIETHELGADIVVEGDEYYTALAAAKAQIPAGYILNAVMVDG